MGHLTWQPEDDASPECRGSLRLGVNPGIDEPVKMNETRFPFLLKSVPLLCFWLAWLAAHQKEHMTKMAHLLQRQCCLTVRDRDLGHRTLPRTHPGSPAP